MLRKILPFPKPSQKKLSKLNLGEVQDLLEPKGTVVRARISRVIDGDTVEVVFLHGGKIPTKIGLRVDGVNTPEKRTKNSLEKEAAFYVRDQVIFLLENREYVHIRFRKWDKYGGRIIGDIIYDKDCTLSEYLLENRYAQPYNGKKKIPFSDEFLEAILTASDD